MPFPVHLEGVAVIVIGVAAMAIIAIYNVARKRRATRP
jgi:hypothetical protein